MSGDELMALEREKRIFEAIRSGDVNGASNQFIVGWLTPQLLTHDSECIYHCNESGDLVSLSSSSSPLSGLVLEAGGATLRQYLKAHPRLPVIERVGILEAVVEAVAFLHKMHIVHFDLKPENIVSFWTGTQQHHQARWKLIDFDTSYDVSVAPKPTISPPATFRLTEEFAAPEVMKVVKHHQQQQQSTEAVEISEAMDIWSLGMVGVFVFVNDTLWRCLHPNVEFNGLMVVNVTQDEVDATLKKTFPHKEAGFLSACLQVEPSSRITAFASLQKKLFTTHDSTVSANALVTMQSTTQKIERLAALLIEYQQLAQGISSESLDCKLSDLLLCLSQQMERIR
jgi:serine/threonine protein kinase